MVGLRDHVVRDHRRLPAAADGVDDVGRHGEARGVAAQALVDLDALGDRGAEVARALGEVALVVVVRLDADLHEAVHQPLHHLAAVVDALHEHRLVAQRDAGVGEHLAGALRLGGDLLGVVEVRVQVQRVVLVQHVAELGGDALRADHRHARADAHDLDVRDRGDLLQQPLEALVGERQRVAAAEEDVADLGVAADVGEGVLVVLVGHRAFVLADDAAPGAVPAVHRAHLGGDEEHAVRVAVRDQRGRRVDGLTERILHVGGADGQLRRGRDALLAHGHEGSSGSMSEA